MLPFTPRGDFRGVRLQTILGARLAHMEQVETGRLENTGIGNRNPVTGQFLPGNNANPNGRPRKGFTYLDKLQSAVNELAGELVAGLIAKGIEGDVRAHVYLRDTLFGVPKQTLQVENDQPSPYDLILGALASRMHQVTDEASPEQRYNVLPPPPELPESTPRSP